MLLIEFGDHWSTLSSFPQHPGANWGVPLSHLF